MKVVGTFLGMLSAVVIGSYIFRRETEETEGEGEIPVTILDKIGDFLVRLTSTEEKRLSQLETETQVAARGLIQELHEAGIEVVVGQTARTKAQEKELIEAGKTSGTLVHSWHELGRALDLYPALPNGQPDYDPDEEGLERYRTMHRMGEAWGFRNIAFNADGSKRLITNSKGKKIWDGGHMQFQGPYTTIAQAWAAEGSEA